MITTMIGEIVVILAYLAIIWAILHTIGRTYELMKEAITILRRIDTYLKNLDEEKRRQINEYNNINRR